MAPRVPIPIREIVYTLSPYQQEIMAQGIKQIPRNIKHAIQETWTGWTIFGTVLFGPIMYANWYKEQEKLHDRY